MNLPQRTLFQQCPLCSSSDLDDRYRIADKRRAELIYWSCAACGLVFLDHSSHLIRTEEHSRYRLHQNNDTPGYRNFLAQVVNPLKAFLSLGDYGLDYGCGPNSVLSLMLAEQGWTMDVYDPYFFPDRNKLTASYDFITCTEVAEHFRFPHQEFDFVDRVLMRPRTRLAIMTSLLPSEEQFSEWWYHREDTHVSFYQLRTLQWIAKRWNWNIVFQEGNVVVFQKSVLSNCIGQQREVI